MINITTNRHKFLISPSAIPADTDTIQYTVTIAGDVVYVGKSKYFGGTYEVDCSSFIESYIDKSSTDVMGVSVSVTFSFNDGSTTTTSVLYWYADLIDLPSDYPAEAYLVLTKCGFKMQQLAPPAPDPTDVSVTIPLSVDNGLLVGKTSNLLDKVTYMDKYNNTHNGSLTNGYEVECYIDPCWLKVTTGNDLEYEKVILALQNAKTTNLYLEDDIKISGMDFTSYTGTAIEVRVKDVEKVDTYSSYSTSKRIPTYKITLEIYK